MWERRKRLAIRSLIDNAKSKPCADCGHQFPLPAMEFDHIRGKKRFNLSQAIAKTTSCEVVQEEIDKCEVICANCHAIRTENRKSGQFKRLEGTVQGTNEI